VTGHEDPAEFLDVNVDQLAGRSALMTFGGSAGAKRERLPNPSRESTADTVESGILSTSAISAPVIHNRRNATIAAVRSGGVLWGMHPGAERRSTKPAGPSARQRASHR
jgi:hypothetical protein